MTHLHAIDLALSATYAALDRNNSPAPVPAKPPRNGDDKSQEGTSAVRPRVAVAALESGEGTTPAAGDAFQRTPAEREAFLRREIEKERAAMLAERAKE